MLRDFARSTAVAQNLVVRCEIGTASTVARQIDNLNHTDIVGTLAGDDTFLVILGDGDRRRDAALRRSPPRGLARRHPLARTPDSPGAGRARLPPRRRRRTTLHPASHQPGFASPLQATHPNKIVVLAYSGGLDTSALIPWLQEKYGYQVVACLVDLGRVKDVPGIMARAEAAGAIAAVAIDAKEEFAEHYCLPALMANALYEDKYPLARPSPGR